MLLGKILLNRLLDRGKNKANDEIKKLTLIFSVIIPLLSGLFTILIWVIINGLSRLLADIGFSNNITLTFEIMFLCLLIATIILSVKKYLGKILSRNNSLLNFSNLDLLLDCLQEFIKSYNKK